MSEKKKSKGNTALWIIWMISIGVFFISALGFMSGGHFTPAIVLGVLFAVDLIAFIIVITVSNKKDQVTPSNSTSTSGASSYSPPPRPTKRVLKDDVLENFDSYIAKEYPDLPLDEFVAPKEAFALMSWGEKEMQLLVDAMKKHIGIDTFAISVHYKKFPKSEDGSKTSGGSFQRTSLIAAVIYINDELTVSQVPACLSHEMAHAFQSFKGKQPYADNSDLEECFTDLLTFYLGFSKYVKRGYYSYNSKLGYVHDGDFLKIEEIYSNRTSSKGSFTDEKEELSKLIETYEFYVGEIVNQCERLSNKYMPGEDKSFIFEMRAKYQSDEINTRINQYKDGLERRAKNDLRSDIIGLEIKLEEIMKDKEKVNRIYNYVFNQ